ncbi:MAG: DUF6691 family protein [Arenicella sp.]
MFRLSAFVAGGLFGIGLAASGMTNQAKVIGFLDVFGHWDPDLMLVMCSAVLTTIISFRFVLKMQKPVLANMFSLPDVKRFDGQLIAGAVLFGIGWGLYGYCPGPAIASLVYLQLPTLIFVVLMLAGMLLANKMITGYGSSDNNACQ